MAKKENRNNSSKTVQKSDSKSTNHVELVVDAIRKAAKEFEKDESDVTKREAASFVSDWSMKRAGFQKVKNAYFPIIDKDLMGIADANDKAKYIGQLEKQIVSQTRLIEAVEEQFKKINFKVKTFKPSKKTDIKRALTVVFSDLHIGSDIRKEETGHLDFGRVQESRRLAKLTKEIIDYKPQYRNSTELNLLLIGDLIQNSLHDPRDGAPGAEQMARAIHLLSQCISHLAENFPVVNVRCSSGNHGRSMARHPQRAVNQKWDSLETVICYALKTIFKNVKNVSFHIPKTPYLTYDVFGKKLFATHGDTVLKPGYPSSAIKTGSLENQINKINATLPDHEEYSVFIVGHVHTASITHLSNNAVMITNGCMVPTDEFAVSIGLLENTCGQYVFESVEGFPVGDCRFIRVSDKDDNDQSLDQIIKPFEGL